MSAITQLTPGYNVPSQTAGVQYTAAKNKAINFRSDQPLCLWIELTWMKGYNDRISHRFSDPWSTAKCDNYAAFILLSSRNKDEHTYQDGF
jgi:hypothetical protein